MSTGPRAASAFNLETQSKVEEDDSHSALFFLFQEVSKLASPASNTIPPSKLLNEASMNNNFITRKDDGGEHSFQPSYSSCQHELPCVWTYNHLKNVRHNSKGSKSGTSAEQRCESNSPLKVLSLINLHCEKLLQKKDVEEFGYTSATLASAAPDVTEVGIKRDNVEYASGPYLHLCEKQEIIASVSPVDDVLGSCLGGGYKQEGCLKIPEGVFRLQQQTEKLDSVRIEIQEDNKTSSLLPPLRDERRRRGHETTRLKQEVTFSVSQLKWNGDVLSVPPHENTLQQTHNLDTCLNTQLIFNSNDKVCKEASKPALILDHNANIGLYSKPPCNIQLSSASTILPSPQSAPQLSDTAESSPFHSENENKSTAAELGSASAYVEEKSPQAAQLNSSVCEVSSAKSEPEVCTVNEEKTDLLSTRRWKTKTPRKQPHPSRSADIQDPNFQGVTFRMDTELDDTKEQCRLLITSKYSKELCKSVRRPRLRTRMLQKSHKTSSSDEEGDLTANVLRSKICASCSTRKTPMWRDAEDGTPLCNACGIRYKKYRVRCVNCWNIPRKEGNSNSRCLKCGNFVRLTSAQRKQTT